MILTSQTSYVIFRDRDAKDIRINNDLAYWCNGKDAYRPCLRLEFTRG